MDKFQNYWHFWNMDNNLRAATIPAYSLYGESAEFPDVLHCERISERAHVHDWRISAHRHLNLHQIFLITVGQVSMSLDGSNFVIPQMSFVSVPRHSVHGFYFEKRTQGFVLSIPSVEVRTLAESEASLADVFAAPQIIPASQKAIGVLETIDREQHAASCARMSLLRALALQFVCHLADNAESENQLLSPLHSKVSDFEMLARDHFDQGWKVSDYASKLGISATHLNRLCRKVLGQSPQAFLHMLVIQEAKRLLAYTRLEVASVGYRIGFDDPSYFSRSFLRCTGQSPRDFRKKYEVG